MQHILYMCVSVSHQSEAIIASTHMPVHTTCINTQACVYLACVSGAIRSSPKMSSYRSVSVRSGSNMFVMNPSFDIIYIQRG